MINRNDTTPGGRRFILLLVAFCVLAAAARTATSDCVDYGNYPHVAGGGAINLGAAQDLVRYGNHVYVPHEGLGVVIYDVSDPAAPIEVGVAGLDANAVAVQDGFLYVAGATGGLTVLGLDGDPSDPDYLGWHPTALPVQSLDASPTWLVGGTHGLDLYIWLRWPDPVDLTGVNRQHPNPVRDVAIDEAQGYLYVARESLGLQVYDLWDALPSLVDEVTGFHIIHGLALDGDRAYLTGVDAGGDGYLTAFDVSDPEDVVQLDTLGFEEPGLDVLATGDVVAVAAEDDGLLLFDAAGGGLTRGGVVPTAQRVRKLTAGATPGLVHVACAPVNGYGRLEAALLPGAEMIPLTARAAVTNGWGLLADGDDLFITTEDSLLVYDTDGLTRRGGLAAPQAVDAELNGSLLYRACHSAGLQILDVQDPEAPTVAGSFASPLAWGVGLGDGFFCLADESTGILVFEDTPVSPPQHRSTLPRWGSYAFYDVACNDQYVYAVGEGDFGDGPQGALIVIKLNSLTTPLVYREIPSPGLDDIEYRKAVRVGDLLYVASVRYLRLYDLTTAGTPALIGSHALPQPAGGLNMQLEVRDGIAYVSELGYGTLVVDCADPGAPRCLGVLEGGVGESITCGAPCDDGVFLLDYYAGLYKAPLHCASVSFVTLPPVPRPLMLEPPVPNPFNPRTTLAFTLPDAQRVRLTVHDLGGRHVLTLFEATLSGGEHTAIWDGTDHAGRAVAAGTYVARLDVEGVVSTRKLVLVK